MHSLIKMSLEDFKNTDAADLSVGMLVSMIARGHAIYINHHIADLNINASQVHLLYEVAYHDNINQEQISARCNINKGAVARSIRKLEEKGFIERRVDENNRRQNMISITPKGKETLEKTKEVLEKWENEVILPKGYVEKELLLQILKEIAVKTIELNHQGE